MSTAKKVKSIDCHDCSELVDEYLAADDEISAQMERRDATRLELDDMVTKFRRRLADEGEISNSVYVHGEEKTVSYSFQNRFKNAPTDYEAEIDSQIGSDLRKRLFTRDTVYKVRTDNIEGLKKVLGPRFNEFVESTEVVIPVSDFRTKVLNIRRTLSGAKRAALDFIEEMFCHRPSLKR